MQILCCLFHVRDLNILGLWCPHGVLRPDLHGCIAVTCFHPQGDVFNIPFDKVNAFGRIWSETSRSEICRNEILERKNGKAAKRSFPFVIFPKKCPWKWGKSHLWILVTLVVAWTKGHLWFDWGKALLPIQAHWSWGPVFFPTIQQARYRCTLVHKVQFSHNLLGKMQMSMWGKRLQLHLWHEFTNESKSLPNTSAYKLNCEQKCLWTEVLLYSA